MSAKVKCRRLWFWWKARRSRCDHCGRHKHLNDAWHSTGNRDGKVWHAECMSVLHWQRVAGERLAVVDLVTDVAGLSTRDVTTLADLRADTGESYRTNEQIDASNTAWRVMYDLEKQQTPEEKR